MRVRNFAVIAAVIGVLGSLSEDLPFITGFLTWTFGLPLRALSAVLSVGETFGRWVQTTALARTLGEWKRGAIDLAEAAGLWFEPIEVGINEPVDELMTTGNGAFGGVLDAIAVGIDFIGGIPDAVGMAVYAVPDFFLGIHDILDGAQDGITDYLPIDSIQEIKGLADVFQFFHDILAFVLDPIGAIFTGLGEVFYTAADIVRITSELTAVESIVFIVGFIGLVAPAFVLLQRGLSMVSLAGTTFGLSLIPTLLSGIPRLLKRATDLVPVMAVGGTLMVWAYSPLFGSLLIAATGIGLTGFGLLRDRGVYGSYGIPVLGIGIMASIAGFGVGFLGYVVMTTVLVFVYINAVQYVETDLRRLIQVGAI